MAITGAAALTLNSSSMLLTSSEISSIVARDSALMGLKTDLTAV